MYYVLSLNGQKAVDMAYSFVGKRCYKSVCKGTHKMAQMEVVIDKEGNYKGNPNKWVDVSYIEPKDIEDVIKILSKIGFKGCPTMLSEAESDGCIEHSKDLCCFII